MTFRALIPLAMAAGLLFTNVGVSHAITSCDVACGPQKPCRLKCYLGQHPHVFVTTCDQVGPCAGFSAGAEAGEGASLACGADPDAAPAGADTGTLGSLVRTWLERSVAVVSEVASQVALLMTA